MAKPVEARHNKALFGCLQAAVQACTAQVTVALH
jgi:hypothetical protein